MSDEDEEEEDESDDTDGDNVGREDAAAGEGQEAGAGEEGAVTSAAGSVAAVLRGGGPAAGSGSGDPNILERNMLEKQRIESVMPTLTDPTLDMSVALEGLTVDAKAEMRRAKDRAMSRGSARLEEAREADIETEAQVRRARAIHKANLKEAEDIPFSGMKKGASSRPGTSSGASSRPGSRPGTSSGASAMATTEAAHSEGIDDEGFELR